MKVVIIGAGRLGGALHRALKRARWNVKLVHRGQASKAAATADLCLLTVPDAAIGLVARGLHTKAALVHCAGALDLSTLPGKRRGSFHPLVAISDSKDSLAGQWVAIAASQPKLRTTLTRLAKALRMHPFAVSENHRPAYHAAAAMSAGLMLSLIDAAVTASGLPPKTAEAALLALAQSALTGAQKRGLAVSLTGPVVRGDVGVVRSHLEALPADVIPLYRALAVRQLALVHRRLPHGTVAALEMLLHKP